MMKAEEFRGEEVENKRDLGKDELLAKTPCKIELTGHQK